MSQGAILKIGALLAATLLMYFGSRPPVESPVTKNIFPVEPVRQPFHFLTSAFPPGGQIPAKYTCDGENVNPELRFGDFPEQTKSLAIIVDDPDAPTGTFTHWVVWNIAPDTKSIPIGGSATAGVQGTTSMSKTGYLGPCPPPGTPHRYFFKLYALDALLDLQAGASRAQLEMEIQKHLLGNSEFFGTYARQ